MTRILLIDDDRRHSDLLKAYLGRFGMELVCAPDADSGLARLESADPDLLLLDVMLPKRDGFDVCREVRRRSSIPIVMLTARDDVIDRVSGLELGADDYVCKPFEPRELVARIQSVLRRVESRGTAREVLKFVGLEIDLEARAVRVDDATVELTSMEFELLAVLARHAGRKMSRDEILVQLRGVDATLLTRSVDIAVSRLRQKIGDTGKPARFIQTVWGRGYVFVGRPVPDDD
ncbi:MAG: response regulator transcription factor [Steroidobacteraceae bacterium]